MSGRAFKTAPIGWFCTACGVVGIEPGVCRGQRGVTHSPQERMAYYRAQDVQPLAEAARQALAAVIGRTRQSAAKRLARLENSGHLTATFEEDGHGPFYTYRLTDSGRSELSGIKRKDAK